MPSSRQVQLALTIVWAVLFIPAILWWSASVPFLVFVSVYANFVGHLSAWQTSKSEDELKGKMDESG